jgi:hypothetical protein
MPKAQDKGSVTLLSHTKTGEETKEPTEQKIDETPSPGVQVLKNNLEKVIASPSSSSSSSARGSVATLDSSTSTSKTPPQPKPRTNSPQTKDDGNETVTTIGANPFGDDSDDGEVEPFYATIGEKSPKKSFGSDSKVGNQNFTPMRRSVSVETVFSPPWDRDKAAKNFREELSKRSTSGTNASSIGSPSVITDDSQQPLLQGGSSNTIKKTNRFLPRAKYAMQQKSFMIPTVSSTFITLYLAVHTALVYLQDHGKFIELVKNPYFIAAGVVTASLLAIGIICAIKQFNNTIEHQIQAKNPNDEVLKKVLDLQSEEKIIKSVRLEYSNNTHSNFTFNTWKSHNGFINIDEKVINRASKIGSIFNNRPLFTALLTGLVVANVTLPWLYAAGVISNVTTFYQSLLTTNIELSLLVASTVLALTAFCLGVHYYRKTGCTNLIYSQDKLDPKNVNEELIKEVKDIRTNALQENHGKDAKGASLTLDQVVVKSHNCPDAIYSVDR